MLTGVEADEAGLRAFGEALSAALDAQRFGRREFAHELTKAIDKPVNASSISQWASGVHEPPRAMVFAMERLLQMRAGALSRHLGYLPASARAVTSVEEALAADPRLDPRARQMLLSAYREAIR